jgi:hypothetical protein
MTDACIGKHLLEFMDYYPAILIDPSLPAEVHLVGD